MKNSTLLMMLSGLLLVACGEAPSSSLATADEPVGTAEAAVCSYPDCDALNWTACGKGGGTTTCSWFDGSTCRTATCSCSSTGRWVCP
jgi:hypothetical protein